MDLKNIAKNVFNQYKDETIIYGIDNGNFWLSTKHKSALEYAYKLNKELITFKRDEVFAESKVKAKVTEPKKKITKVKNQKKTITKK